MQRKPKAQHKKRQEFLTIAQSFYKLVFYQAR